MEEPRSAEGIVGIKGDGVESAKGARASDSEGADQGPSFTLKGCCRELGKG